MYEDRLGQNGSILTKFQTLKFLDQNIQVEELKRQRLLNITK